MKKIILFNLVCIGLWTCSMLYAENQTEQLVILGAGPAGLTAAIYAGQANLAPLVVEGNSYEGQLETVYHIENFPGFPEGINGKELVERMHVQAEKFGAHFQAGTVVDIDLRQRPFRLVFSDGYTVYTKTVVIALGTAKRRLGLAAEEVLKGKGIGVSATYEAPLFQDKEVVVFGGSDASLEEALVLTQYAAKVTLIYRGSQLTAAPYLQNRVHAHDKIAVVLDTTIEDILDIAQNRVTGVALRHIKTNTSSILPCEGLFIAVGRQPNVAIFQGQLEMTGTGSIITQPASTQTSIPGVFAAGDVSDATYRKAITAAGMGCAAAIDAIQFLTLPARR